MSPARVLVTGAAGSVGHFLVEEFLREGYQVVASDLPNSPLPRQQANLSIRPADLTSPGAAESLVDGAELVVHTAALIDIALPFARLEAVNLTATKALYGAAKSAGVRRFLFFSSGSTYRTDPAGSYSEEMPLEAGNDYELSKILCEDFLREQSRSGGPELVVMRPSLIYGPRGKMLGAALACMAPLMHEHLRLVVGLRGGPRSNWVHALDVARAAVHLARRGAPGEAYNVCDDDAIPIGDLASVAAEAYGLPVRFHLSYPSLALCAKAVPILEKAGFLFTQLNGLMAYGWEKVCDKYSLKRELKPKLDREALAYAYRDTIFRNDKLKATGFALQYPSTHDGFPPTIRWYQQEHWVPTY